MKRFLIGGGWTEEVRSDLYGPFIDAAGPEPRIACVVLDEGDGQAQFQRWEAALFATAACTPIPVLVPEGGRLDIDDLPAADAMLVCGGLTPAYADALVPVAEDLLGWLGDKPYAGFSAGAAIASDTAVVGGWLLDGVPICPEDSGEDLDELGVVRGLGLVPFAVEVHAAQWGNLARLIAAVADGAVPLGIALDEDAMVTVEDGGGLSVSGRGQAHVVRRDGQAVSVSSYRSSAVPL